MFVYVLCIGEHMDVLMNRHIENIFEKVDGVWQEKEAYASARESAESVLEANELLNCQNIGIVRLAMKYGFVVATAALPSDVQGIIAYDESGEKQLGTKYSKLIVVDNRLTTEQKRFVVAHELGHYVMSDRSTTVGEHIERRITNSNHHGNRSERENRIDYFAACLLMPYTTVVTELKNILGNKTLQSLNVSEKIDASEKLSETFKVSSSVAYRRIEEVQAMGIQ